MKSHPDHGWTWLWNARRWHYFIDRQSICGRFLTFVKPHDGYEIGNDDSKQNCTSCRKKLAAMKKKGFDELAIPEKEKA